MMTQGAAFFCATATTMRDITGVWNTRTRLLASGERLIGHRGLQGVSLEQVATDAGQANKYAVQYHFKSKQAFAEAILAARRGRLEQCRADRVAQLMSARDIRLESWVAALFLPLAEQTDEQGGYSFARFLLQFRVQFERWDAIAPDAGLPQDNSATLQLTERLLDMAGERDRIAGYWKLSLSTVTFCSALIGLEQESDTQVRAARLAALSRMLAAGLKTL